MTLIGDKYGVPAAQRPGGRAALEAKGQPIANMDLLIAAHARSLPVVLVTNNERHHVRIPGLKIENWAKR